MEKKIIRITADELLAAMMYYFKFIDPADFILLSNYVIEELKKQYPEWEIMVEGNKNPYSNSFRSNKLIPTERWSELGVSGDDGEKVLDYKDSLSVKKDIIVLSDWRYQEYLKKVDCTGNARLVFDTLSKFASPDARNAYNESKKQKMDSMRRSFSKLNVLLISNRDEDYQALTQIGIKNINWFKSIVRANKYFDEHPDELANHHLVFVGLQAFEYDPLSINGNEPDNVLRRKIEKLSEGPVTQEFVISSTTKYELWKKEHRPIDEKDESAKKVYTRATLSSHVCYPNGLSQDYVLAQDMSYRHMADFQFANKLCEFLLVKYPAGKIPELQFKEVKDYKVAIGQQLPKYISQVKILTDCDASFLRDKYGLINIVSLSELFPGVDRDSVEYRKYLKDNLGKYHIILIKENYDSLSGLINPQTGTEISEQSKDTGLKLGLACLYRGDKYDIDVFLPYYKSYFKYSVGGLYEKKPLSTSKVFDTVCDNMTSDEYEKFKIEEAVRGALSLYNSELANRGYSEITLPFKSSFEQNEEYAREWERIANNLCGVDPNREYIEKFDKARKMVLSYLRYYNQRINGHRVINSTPSTININRCSDGNIEVEIKNPMNERSLGIITFAREDEFEDLRIIKIQRLNKKTGLLVSPETVGLYTKYWEGKDVPRRPNEDELNVLNAIIKRIEQELPAIIDEAEKSVSKLASLFNTFGGQQRNRIKKAVQPY